MNQITKVVSNFRKLRKEFYRNLTWSETIEIINDWTATQVYLDKTLTSVPYVFKELGETSLLNLLYLFIFRIKQTVYSNPDLKFLNKLSPWVGELKESIFNPSMKYLEDLNYNEWEKINSDSCSNIDNMVLEYSILLLFLTKNQEHSEYRDFFMNISQWCLNNNQSMKYLFRVSIKILVFKFFPEMIIPNYIDLRKQIVNGDYCDLWGSLPEFPRTKVKKGYDFDNGVLKEGQPKAEALLELNKNKAKELLKYIQETPEPTVKRIIEIDFNPIMMLMTKNEHYILAKFK